MVMRFITITAVLAAMLPTGARDAFAQPGSSDFQPRTELNRLLNSPMSFQRVRQLYYLGDLTSKSAAEPIARQAFRQAMLSFNDLTGGHRTLALPWAAQSILGLAGLSHLEFRATPLRWESYEADSLARWELMSSARSEYAVATDIGYGRATFEALYLRAHLLEEWDDDHIDQLAEQDYGPEPIARAFLHVNVARQLMDRAAKEYDRMIILEDSLGLVGGTGDSDVSRWTSNARRRLGVIAGRLDTLAAREEALQCVYAERNALVWLERAVPLLWSRADEVAKERSAGLADPFVDYAVQTQLVNKAFRPFVFGKDGFYTIHKRAAEVARAVRDTDWLNARFTWQRDAQWLDAEVSRQLAQRGVEHLRRVPAELAEAAERLSARADSLSPEWQQALAGLPEPPDPTFPPTPDFGSDDPRILMPVDSPDVAEKFSQFMGEVSGIMDGVRQYGTMVDEFVEVAGQVTSEEMPPAMGEYLSYRGGLLAAEILLLDSLSATVRRDAENALSASRGVAVWLPSGTRAVQAVQAIRDYRQSVSYAMREVALTAESEATRYEQEADELRRAPPARPYRLLADKLRRFATDLQTSADAILPPPTAASP